MPLCSMPTVQRWAVVLQPFIQILECLDFNGLTMLRGHVIIKKKVSAILPGLYCTDTKASLYSLARVKWNVCECQLLHTLFFLAEFWAALYSDISFCRRFSRLCSANKNPSSNNCRATSPVPSSFVYSDTMSSITGEVTTYKVIYQTQVNTRYINSVTRTLKNVG